MRKRSVFWRTRTVLIVVSGVLALVTGGISLRMVSSEYSNYPNPPDSGFLAFGMRSEGSKAVPPLKIDIVYDVDEYEPEWTAIQFKVSMPSAATRPLIIEILSCGPLVTVEGAAGIVGEGKVKKWTPVDKPDNAFLDAPGPCGTLTMPLFREVINGRQSDVGDVRANYRHSVLNRDDDKVAYGLPGVRILRSANRFGEVDVLPLADDSIAATSLGGTLSESLRDRRGSPDLSWPSQFKWIFPLSQQSDSVPRIVVGGVRGEVEGDGQRIAFLAGALAGISGGFCVWFLELLASSLVPAKSQPRARRRFKRRPIS